MSDVEATEEHDSIAGIPAPVATYALHGHLPQWRALVEAHQSGRLHHAWLLQGPRGIGKATAAFAFARRLLSLPDATEDLGPGSDATDAVARQIAGGSHPNLVHITRPVTDKGTGFKTQITVEEIRKLNRFFRTTTSAKQWRVAIIDPADDMNRNAANALLKILEEPPERSIFLITNHMPGRLLPTIRSRCRVLRFDPLAADEMAATLATMPLGLGEDEMKAAIGLSDGSVRTAVSLIASGGLELEVHLRRILAASEPAWPDIHALADALTQKGRETAFELTLAAAFKHLAEEAEARLAKGEVALASRQAALWASENERLREGLAYNLDRKQMLLSFFDKLFALRSGRPG